MARRKDGIKLSKISALAKAVMRHSHLTIDEMLEVAERGAEWKSLNGLSHHEVERAFINFSLGTSDAYAGAMLEDALAWYALKKAAKEKPYEQ